jgi:hypothetical protein
VNQLDPIGVDDGEEGRIRQEVLSLLVLHPQCAEQPSALGQAAEQVGVVAVEPAIEASKRAAFQGEQQADGDQFARPQLCLRVLVPAGEAVVYQADQPDDKILGGHRLGPPDCDLDTHSLRPDRGRSVNPSELAPVVS